MFFRQLLHEDNEHVCAASYVVADRGVGVVVDPAWDVAEYLELARKYHFRIEHVIDTHVHSDHVSGARELAGWTGAAVHLPVLAPADFAHERLDPGATVEAGDLRITAMPAPGHRPEHMVLSVSDRSRWHDPWLLLTGDSLGVGGVAVPDVDVDAAEGLRALFHTLRRLRLYADAVELWPGHVGGPLGGLGALSQKSSSTVGAERLWNPLLAIDDEDAFAAAVRTRVRGRPAAARRIVALNINAVAPRPLDPPPLEARDVSRLVDDGAVVLDGRSPELFDRWHVDGALNLPLAGRAVGTRAAQLLERDTPLVAVAETYRGCARMVRLLEAAGLTGTHGAFLARGLPSHARPLAVGSAEALTPAEAGPVVASGRVRLVDVREPEEWKARHVRGSVHLPVWAMGDAPAPLSPDEPVLVACEVGNRAALGASLLRRRGFTHVRRLTDGGVADLARHGVAMAAG